MKYARSLLKLRIIVNVCAKMHFTESNVKNLDFSLTQERLDKNLNVPISCNARPMKLKKKYALIILRALELVFL